MRYNSDKGLTMNLHFRFSQSGPDKKLSTPDKDGLFKKSSSSREQRKFERIPDPAFIKKVSLSDKT